MAGSSTKAMWSKTTRIKLMIVIDTTFFLIELISGLLSHSLALTADAFHMLNDIISLVIGLWAVIASQKATTDEFTFGWVRAEILGAFFNAVFLIALCVSIILEAFTRFFDPPEIDNPKLILCVGAAGLASNLLGFLVLGGHGHDHGHDHDHEEGHAHAHAHAHAHEHGTSGHAHGDDHAHQHGHDHPHHHDHDHDVEEGIRSIPADTTDPAGDYSPEAMLARLTAATAERSTSDAATRRSEESGRARRTSHSRSRGRESRRGRAGKAGHTRFASIEDMSIHPASFRQDIIAASLAASTPGAGGADDYDSDGSPIDSGADEQSPLLKGSNGNGANPSYSTTAPTTTAKTTTTHAAKASHKSPATRRRRDSSVHDGHNHTLPRKPGSKVSGHSHADMGMNAMVLHVLGDALGNVGVIVSALIIWLTNWPGKLYADPAVSLFITLIILKTSIPLTIATSRVLLQATPENLSVSEIREDIQRLPGVVHCHHMHVWQLSDTKIVASLHLQVAFPINTHSGEKYMQLAKRVRKCLHGYGIHSATIQPEFNLDDALLPADSSSAATAGANAGTAPAAIINLDGSVDPAPAAADCLIECVDDCAAQGCCTNPDVSSSSSTRRGSHSSAAPHQH